MPWNGFPSARKASHRSPQSTFRPQLEELERRLAPSATSVLQYHDGPADVGQNLSETTLTTADVNSTGFGKRFSTAVDGQVYAQPLVVSGLNIGGASRNVVFVATEHDSVYAIDADSGAVLWQKNYLQTGERTLTTSDVGSTDLGPQIGITGTPVIDPASGTLYFVTKATTAAAGTNASTANTVQRLHAVDLATGAEKFGGPVVISASVNGTGVGNDGHGHVPFDAPAQQPAHGAGAGQRRRVHRLVVARRHRAVSRMADGLQRLHAATGRRLQRYAQRQRRRRLGERRGSRWTRRGISTSPPATARSTRP